MPKHPPYEHKDVDDLGVFYYNLYHHLAHLAAYVAMMGVLLTIGFFLSTTGIASGSCYRCRVLIVAFLVGVSLVAGLFFILFGMNRYGKQINLRVPYLMRPTCWRHYLTVAVGALAAIVLAAIDWGLLYLFWK